jgi:hypothetical protein
MTVGGARKNIAECHGDEPMGVRSGSRWPSVLLVLVLCACAAKDDIRVEPNIPPANYKTEILDQLRMLLTDPTNIRDAFLAEPVLKPYGRDTRYIACLRFNARNSDGSYIGSRDRAVFFYAGKLTAIIDASRDLCGNAAYQPFPELQQLCRELVCPSASPAR